LLDLAEERRAWALVVDLPGAESVAFAAGLQPRAVAVFQFHNWPHPRGVVPAHLTLAAAAYYRHRFQLTSGPEQRAACYVLDRDRLAPYRNEANRFDNRYVVNLPTAASLQQRGIRRVLYVVPDGQPAEALDDLAERFAEYTAAGITVRMLGLGDLTLAATPTANNVSGSSRSRYYWHGSPSHHYWFWNHHDWPSRPAPLPPTRPPTTSFGAGWSAARPRQRQDLSRLGRSTETVPTTSGGSWGRSSGGFGG
jgi:hypothetical protein